MEDCKPIEIGMFEDITRGMAGLRLSHDAIFFTSKNSFDRINKYLKNPSASGIKNEPLLLGGIEYTDYIRFSYCGFNFTIICGGN